jgi:hypothetical protein
MTSRRHGFLLIALIVGSALVVGTTSVSSVTMDRGLQLEVVEDQHAYLGFEQTPTNTENGITDLNVSITNQFQAGADLTTVEVTINGTTHDFGDSDGVLSPGETEKRTFASVPCGASITVRASGSDIRINLERLVDCQR